METNLQLIIKPGCRVNGHRFPTLTPATEVTAMLAELAGIHRGQRSQWAQQELAFIELLQTATTRQAQPDDFGVVLWSVGNPDFGQFHGPGEGSPTLLVFTQTLLEIQLVVTAYIACFNLGGGNCPLFPVFRRQVHVADVSYNRRLWEPGTRREIDPETGATTS